jgi:hypothetical protein
MFARPNQDDRPKDRSGIYQGTLGEVSPWLDESLKEDDLPEITRILEE